MMTSETPRAIAITLARKLLGWASFVTGMREGSQQITFARCIFVLCLVLFVAVGAVQGIAEPKPAEKPNSDISKKYDDRDKGTIQKFQRAGGTQIRTGAGLCLDVHAPDAGKNGGRVQVWACNGQPQQRWTFDSAASALRAASGLCLDVHAPDMTTNGGRVQVWACNAAPQQQWTPLANGSLQSAGGLCLDVHAADQAKNGGRVQVWQCNDSQQQRFTPGS